MYCVKVNNMKPIILRLSLRMNLNDFFLEKVNPYFLRNPFKSLENHETFYKIDLTNFSWSWINPFCSLIQFSFNSFFLHNLSKKKNCTYNYPSMLQWSTATWGDLFSAKT